MDLSLARYAAPNPEKLELKTIYSVPNVSGNIDLENAIRWGVGDELENASGNVMIDHIAEKIEADMSGFNDHYLLAFDAKKKFKIFICIVKSSMKLLYLIIDRKFFILNLKRRRMQRNSK